MKKLLLLKTAAVALFSTNSFAQPKPAYNLQSDTLATLWYDAMPLGNGMLGALVWKEKDLLKLSLDRADLWDDRPMPGIDQFTFKWVAEKVKHNQYDSAQAAGDAPYETNAAPTKIPGAAITFPLAGLGEIQSNTLDIATGTNTIRFRNGCVFHTFVQANSDYGLFIIDNAPANFTPTLVTPAYTGNAATQATNSVDGQSLQRLGYAAGKVTTTANSLHYHQPTYNGQYYEVTVRWQQLPNNRLAGSWTITHNANAQTPILSQAFINKALQAHTSWWKQYWAKSSVQLPDTLLAKQYYLDMYKFGAVARNNTPPITLQAVWTADNGKLPPWKGDIHHDLNTELSYWPGYTANHLDLTAGFTNWLWNTRGENKRWTKQYFGVNGLNVPGVSTISAKPMGGWIQYSLSPTTAAWLSQHFYWQWKYSNDKTFLLTRCKPWFDEVATYLRALRITDPVSGQYKHPLSSSPEFNDNNIKAWFPQFTNYDLALVRFFFEKYAEINEAATGKKTTTSELAQYPYFSTDTTGLLIAPGQPLNHSHRHHSHMIGIYPLKVISYNNPKEKAIIDHSLAWMEKKGTRQWVGYSFAWAACLYAQTGNGDSAVSMLRRFAGNFVGANSFHLNGDQKGGQYSGFTYNPFTLEGNFAYAQGIHELLLQTHNGVTTLFPAIPATWLNVSFKQLRGEDGHIYSATVENGELTQVTVLANKNGSVVLHWPYKTVRFEQKPKTYKLEGDKLTIHLQPGTSAVFHL
ncbi:glycoside hydrolase family 95-like protein [Chitinophaga sp. sic0106]|uniref:glycosyl hydrolase family 95 catalytic domain-containing protein n=1 Tax=Chitinophaga sp. sic0106 TaxID=2854785 RepID=UPI001C48D5E6|nr:hypothetical protein [Chitinophaga sp. sic0106]MBV7533079.1 hypothetical protein [Chitinophaga sp. sic0106]